MSTRGTTAKAPDGTSSHCTRKPFSRSNSSTVSVTTPPSGRRWRRTRRSGVTSALNAVAAPNSTPLSRRSDQPSTTSCMAM
jgi:hypothetical protein